MSAIASTCNRHPDRRIYAKNGCKSCYKNIVYRKTQYGITQAEYTRMVEEQGNLCKACGNPETRIRNGAITELSVDHDHITGRVRGLLCTNCNIALGHVQDDVALLNSLVTYLEMSQFPA